ncbi:MAG: NAD(P)-dependent alcohol dehydrogenase [Pseudomonadota bacterium]
MKALIFKKYGSPDFLAVQDVEKPKPAADQVLINVKAVSVNDWDYGLLHGSPFLPNRFMAGLFRPHIILGCDIAGVVEAVGSAVRAYQPGDDVYGDLSGCGFGGFAEYVCPPERAVRPKSPSMSFEQAAAIPQAGMLALQGVQAGGDLESRHTVLVNGAGGGVGSIAIQLLRGHDLEVTGVDSAAKLDAMRSWGFDHVIDYANADFTRDGQRYDLIVDAHSDRVPADYERALNPDGVYATVGGDSMKLLRIALSGVRLRRARDKTLRVIALQANRDLAYFNELFEARRFKPVIDSEFEFTDNDVRQAFHRFGASAHKGKIVVRL